MTSTNLLCKIGTVVAVLLVANRGKPHTVNEVVTSSDDTH